MADAYLWRRSMVVHLPIQRTLGLLSGFFSYTLIFRPIYICIIDLLKTGTVDIIIRCVGAWMVGLDSSCLDPRIIYRWRDDYGSSRFFENGPMTHVTMSNYSDLRYRSWWSALAPAKDCAIFDLRWSATTWKTALYSVDWAENTAI
jgi:hypothetical protein